MKPAEVKRVLVRERVVRRKRDGKVVRVRVRRYRVERPEVEEVRTLGYETEYRLADGRALAAVWCSPRYDDKWGVWAQNRSDMLKHEAVLDSRADAERHARKLLREAGYRVRRAK